MIIFMVIVIVILALAWMAIDMLPMIQPVFKNLLKLFAIVIAIVSICNKAGWKF